MNPDHWTGTGFEVAMFSPELVMERGGGEGGEWGGAVVPTCLTCLKHHHGGGAQSVHSLIYPVPIPWTVLSRYFLCTECAQSNLSRTYTLDRPVQVLLVHSVHTVSFIPYPGPSCPGTGTGIAFVKYLQSY
jgi:hypothetical protein